jgi:hypothetical protein
MATATQDISILRASNGRDDDYMSEELLAPNGKSEISNLKLEIPEASSSKPKAQSSKLQTQIPRMASSGAGGAGVGNAGALHLSGRLRGAGRVCA